MEVTVIRVIFGYAIGILVSFVLGSIAGTQVVLASVQAMGLEVSGLLELRFRARIYWV